jgi:hypothetical protein
MKARFTNESATKSNLTMIGILVIDGWIQSLGLMNSYITTLG